MKISDVNLALRDVPQQAAAERAEAAPEALSFKRQLTDMSDEGYRRHINDLITEITRQGELLGKRADIKELQKYRGMVTELLNETVSNAYAFSKNNAFDSRGRHRVYAMIKKVNLDLEQLTEEVLKEQSDNLRVLDLVDDIRGLLVDIYM